MNNKEKTEPLCSKPESERRSKKQGCPLSFNKEQYARRNVIERCINRLKQWRGVGCFE
jgi:hypothetical protein